MSIRQAPPLPECLAPDCGRPTKRAVWEETGGMCTTCASELQDTVRLLPVGKPDAGMSSAERRRALLERPAPMPDETVFVEMYRPPVPGQLEIVELPPLLEPLDEQQR